MKKIVAIGGGEIKDFETWAIDKEIVKLASKTKPLALFIPTASEDAEGYWKTFQSVYGSRLKCETDALFLIKEHLTIKQIKDKINSADIIYVGGGNTLKMIKIWRKLQVDKLLLNAYHKGTVLSGLSAGAICWFSFGFSDSAKFSKNREWNFMKVRGLNFIQAIFCPHYHKESREEGFKELIKRYGGIGIALGNNTALEIIDEKFRVIGSQKETHAYRIYKKNKEIITEELKEDSSFKPLSLLLNN